MILVIDNYDSFVYNISHYIEILGYESLVKRNDKVSILDIKELNPSHIILSPGPCTPNESGICLDIIKELAISIPILGICLGHQAIGQIYGANIIKAIKPMHGKKSLITTTDSILFNGFQKEVEVGRYHSLIISEKNLSNDISVTARCQEQQVMALEHKSLPLYGVQFHPESILTKEGIKIIENFIDNTRVTHS